MSGDRRALARSISLIECRLADVASSLPDGSVRRVQGPGTPHVVGVTGPPGAGKSTFVDRLVAHARADGLRVAVVAIDPSSPFSGGAILGDRIRMERHAVDERVYIRSLSNRGHLGGLSTAASQVVDLLDAVGFDLVLVETVGVGQSELGIMQVADTVLVVLTPESGDSVQAMKAGLLEIADVFVVNKADRPGADRLARSLSQSVEIGQMAWPPPVHTASATEGEGVEQVVASVQAHLEWCLAQGSADWSRRRGDARLSAALDWVAERARDHASSGLSAQQTRGLRSGRLSGKDVFGGFS